jgi:hypothetical protein
VTDRGLASASAVAVSGAADAHPSGNRSTATDAVGKRAGG